MTEPTKYLWAIKVTTELLSYPNATDPRDESNPHVDETFSEIRPCASEDDARARVEQFDYAEKRRAAGHGFRHPRHQRVTAVELLRRPVGDWEEVQS